MGWFPRGFLIEPALEEAAFALEEGEFSPVIETRLGYHILQNLAKDPARLLDSQARLILQRTALEAWLADNRLVSEIEIFVAEYR